MDQVEKKKIEDKWKHLTQPEMYSEYIDYIYDTSTFYSRDGEHQIEEILSIKLHWQTTPTLGVQIETSPEFIHTNKFFLSARLQEKNPRSNNHIIRNGIDRDLTDYIKWLRGKVINLI